MLRSRKTVATVVGLAAAALATTAGPAAAADDARGKQLEAGTEAYQRAYPKITLEAAQLAAKQQDERKELYHALAKGGEKTFGGAAFDPTSGILKVVRDRQGGRRVRRRDRQAARPQGRDQARHAQLRGARAPGRRGAQPQG